MGEALRTRDAQPLRAEKAAGISRKEPTGGAPGFGRALLLKELRDSMAKYSKRWHESILRSRNHSTGLSVLESPFPIMPWLTHALDPKLETLMLRLGERRRLRAGERLFGPGEPIDRIAMVCSGVTARSLGNSDGQAIGLALPGRIAAGNLNFFSGRHAIGRYFALSDCELCFCPQPLLLSVLCADPALFHSCAAQFECAALSDRLAFACLSLLGGEDRLKAFTAAWAASYGELLADGWIRMPSPMSLQVRSQVINATPNWVDRISRRWREAALWRREGEWTFARPALLQEAYAWMRGLEEADNRFSYPARFEALFDPPAR